MMFTEWHFTLYHFFYQYPIWWYSFIAIISAMAGSFMTMLCYRLPILLAWKEVPQHLDNRHMSLMFPRSFCPHCQQTIRWWQNIPLLSYLGLRGQCYWCKRTIAIHYFMMELLCVVFSLITAWVVQDPIQSLWWCLFVWISLAMIVLDIRYLLLPDSLNYTLLWSGLLFAITMQRADTAIISAVIGYASFAIINFIYKGIRQQDGIGQGDFKLLAAIAVWITWYELPQMVLLSSLLGLTYALIIFFQNKKVDMKLALPFAPFLLLGAWLWVMYLNAFRFA